MVKMTSPEELHKESQRSNNKETSDLLLPESLFDNQLSNHEESDKELMFQEKREQKDCYQWCFIDWQEFYCNCDCSCCVGRGPADLPGPPGPAGPPGPSGGTGGILAFNSGGNTTDDWYFQSNNNTNNYQASLVVMPLTTTLTALFIDATGSTGSGSGTITVLINNSLSPMSLPITAGSSNQGTYGIPVVAGDLIAVQFTLDTGVPFGPIRVSILY